MLLFQILKIKKRTVDFSLFETLTFCQMPLHLKSGISLFGELGRAPSYGMGRPTRQDDL
jgi:hypothetical protein